MVWCVIGLKLTLDSRSLVFFPHLSHLLLVMIGPVKLELTLTVKLELTVLSNNNGSELIVK